MSGNSYKISTQRQEEHFVIVLKGEFLLQEMSKIRDALIQQSGGKEAVLLKVYPDEELSVSVLQLLLSFKRMVDADVELFISESSEQVKLLEKSGFANHFEIKN